MSRHLPGSTHGGIDVRASGMEVVTKKIQKDLGGGVLGLQQIRSTKNVISDPRLQRILSCMASGLAGKKYANLGAVQNAFKARRAECTGVK